MWLHVTNNRGVFMWCVHFIIHIYILATKEKEGILFSMCGILSVCQSVTNIFSQQPFIAVSLNINMLPTMKCHIMGIIFVPIKRQVLDK